MPVTRPCIRGQMGSTEFYETTMKARELASAVRPAGETDGWASQSIEERMQRDVNINRVKKTIVPYLAEHPDRFFGSFIVLAEAGAVEFEPLGALVADLPGAYRSASEGIGYLTINQGELIALDGQHRLVAFREVIQQAGGSNAGHFSAEVGDDDVCVLFIVAESLQKTRRIFNKVNRNAKPTGKSDNIITSEDDGFAIITRRLLDHERHAPLAQRHLPTGVMHDLVEWHRTNLNTKNQELTTLSAVYETVTDILTHNGFQGFSEASDPVAPPEEAIERGFEITSSWWEQILELPVFEEALAHPEDIPDIRFDNENDGTLMLRPVGQMVLVKGVIEATERSRTELDFAEAIARCGRIRWNADPASMWRDIIVRPDGRMIARKEAYRLGADLLAHMIAPEFESEEQKQALYIKWNDARGKDPYSEPEFVDPFKMPEDLPAPPSY